MYMANPKIFGFYVGGYGNFIFLVGVTQILTKLWGFALRVMQILGLALGETQILPFLDTNILVSPMQDCGIGGLSQRQDPKQMVLGRSGI